MARTWLSIRVDLVSGRGEDMWPQPGRVFAAARSHTFAQLARAIDLAFARWDLAHMHMFTLTDRTQITRLSQWDGDAPDGSVDDSLKLSRLAGGDQFAYVFDFGDDWAHLCTVEPERIDPLDTVGITPPTPTAYRGWATCPISTAAASTLTTARPTCPSHPSARSLTYHRSCPGGANSDADQPHP